MSSPPHNAIDLEILKARQRHADGEVEAAPHQTDALLSDDVPGVPRDALPPAEGEVERLRDLLLEPRLGQVRQHNQDLERQLDDIERQLADPDMRREWVRSVLTSALVSEADRSAAELGHAFSPILAEALAAQVRRSPAALGKTIAPEMAIALREQVRLEPEAIANAIAPEMGKAIKDQIVMERDAMVDALYPVIGSTISKYLAATLETINRKVEETLSVEGVKRKIRARIQGVSEAELLLSESVPFFVQNAFLIHKNSGLIIAEVQQAEGPALESDMIAGMLTAIRSFVNEYIAQSGDMSELDDIKYGNAQVMLEVAGYCYLAVVVQGQPPQAFAREMSRTLSHIVQSCGDEIEAYEGDPSSIPADVRVSLEQFRDRYALTSQPLEPDTGGRGPSPLAVGVAVLALVLLLWGGGSWLSHRLAATVERTLFAHPELSVYRVEVDAQKGLWHPRGTVQLSGRVPDTYLQQKAAEVASATVPVRTRVVNDIFTVETPAIPTQTAAEIDRLAATYNRQAGVDISTTLADGRVTVRGRVTDAAEAEAIAKTMADIPGVRHVTNVVVLTPLTLPTRIYFGANAAQVPPAVLESKLERVRTFLERYPDVRLRVIGHSDTNGDTNANQQLALRRAQAVKYALELTGIAPTRLEAIGIGEPPPGSDPGQPRWLSRTVRFEPLRSPTADPV